MLRDIASIATAGAVLLAAAQLWLARRQSRVSFEDEMTREYRNIARSLPVTIFLKRPGSDAEASEWEGCLDDFYKYFDLCNEQVFLRKEGRVSTSTWENWRAGIGGNLDRPDFRAAWAFVEKRAEPDFQELRSLVASNFCADPRRPWFSRLALRGD